MGMSASSAVFYGIMVTDAESEEPLSLDPEMMWDDYLAEHHGLDRPSVEWVRDGESPELKAYWKRKHALAYASSVKLKYFGTDECSQMALAYKPSLHESDWGMSEFTPTEFDFAEANEALREGIRILGGDPDDERLKPKFYVGGNWG